MTPCQDNPQTREVLEPTCRCTMSGATSKLTRRISSIFRPSRPAISERPRDGVRSYLQGGPASAGWAGEPLKAGPPPQRTTRPRCKRNRSRGWHHSCRPAAGQRRCAPISAICCRSLATSSCKEPIAPCRRETLQTNLQEHRLARGRCGSLQWRRPRRRLGLEEWGTGFTAGSEKGVTSASTQHRVERG